MSEQTKVEPLMTEDEIQVLKQISNAEVPHGQRVQALLAVAVGKSQEEAAEISGLRPTQVKYWVARYQKVGVACFPESLFEEKEAEVEVAEKVEEEETLRTEPAEVAVVIEEAPSPKKKKKKKDKKAKSVKKSKKAKTKKKKKKESKKSKKDKKEKKKKKKKAKSKKKQP